MDTLKLGCILLLPLTMCFKYQWEETLVKSIRREPDTALICANETQNIITLIVCKIRTQRSGRGSCRLLYQHGRDFEHECDSRFTLLKENQTVFLHMISLTAEDCGSYTCECTKPDGTFILHINVTLEEKKEAYSSTEAISYSASIYLIGAAVIISGVILGFIYLKSHRGYSRSEVSGLSLHKIPSSVDEDDPEDPYSSLHQPTDYIYDVILSPRQIQHRNCPHELSRSGSEL